MLLASTVQRRQLSAAVMRELATRVDPVRFITLLDRLRLTALIGRRWIDLLAPSDPSEARAAVHARERAAAQYGALHEMVTRGVLLSLERAGIRALALKGSLLALQLYDDVALRSTSDIDILVSAEDLPHAVAVVQKMGWRRTTGVSQDGSLPVLHETLHHARLPAVELHWRLHWHETCFAADALDRAERCGRVKGLVLSPEDGLVALVMFYVRDGLSGLRFPADAAAWWDGHCAGLGATKIIMGHAERYPELSKTLLVGASLLSELVALPFDAPEVSFSLRVARGLATPFNDRPLTQLAANVSLVDLLLSPADARSAALAREAQKIPALGRPLRRQDGVRAYRLRTEHVLRILRRWLIVLPMALLRASLKRDLSAAIPRYHHASPGQRIERGVGG